MRIQVTFRDPYAGLKGIQKRAQGPHVDKKKERLKMACRSHKKDFEN